MRDVAKKTPAKRRKTGGLQSKIRPLEEEILAAIGDGMSQREVALLLGVTPFGFKKYIRENRDFHRRMKQAEQVRVRTLLKTIQAKSRKDWSAARWLLAVTNPDRYSNRAVEQAAPAANVNTQILIQQHADWYGTPNIEPPAVSRARADSAAASAANLA